VLLAAITEVKKKSLPEIEVLKLTTAIETYPGFSSIGGLVRGYSVSWTGPNARLTRSSIFAKISFVVSITLIVQYFLFKKIDYNRKIV